MLIKEDHEMKSIALLIFSFYFLIENVHAQANKRPWIFFDLGDTVISARDFKHLHYMPGAREYVRELKRAGYHIGLITNIPESWGSDYQQKFETLKKFVSDGWEEPSEFEWDVFDEVILPLSNSELKPNPALFLKAIARSNTCPSAFIGESPKEVAAAKNTGMASKLFVEQDAELYIPIDQLPAYLRDNYKLDYDQSCLE